MQAIVDPKVFISYAWGTEDYQEKVLQFCSRLQTECGIQVVIDKWSMAVGNDTYDFMERCVNDPNINFVLMLLEKNYAEKADARIGGVGTETQIISAQVYADTAQSKFVPIVFERDTDGSVHKPHYLNGRLHFDLTTENANVEFMRLVRHLYGEKTYPVPPLGKKPDWVSQPPLIPPIISGSLYTVRNATDEVAIKGEIKMVLSRITRGIFDLSPTDEETQQFNINPQKYLNYLEQFKSFRDAVIVAFEIIKHKSCFVDIAAEFFEDYKANQDDKSNKSKYLIQSTPALLHEIFLYIISLLWESEEYSKIHDLILRTYFTGGSSRNITTADFCDIVYSGSENEAIDNAKRKVDNKKYYSGVAQLWTEHVMLDHTLEQLVFSDLLVHNIDILEKPEGSWYWFPLLYGYGLNNRTFIQFCTKMKSKHQLEKYEGLFGKYSTADLQAMFLKMKNVMGANRYRFSNSFDRAPLILDYVNADEIGTLN